MPEAKSVRADGSSQKKSASKEGRAFLEALVNAEARNNIWRNVAILLSVLVMMMLYSLVRMSQTVPVRLIPYEVATGSQMIEVGPNGENAKEYLAYIAEADLMQFTSWRHDTVSKRYAALSKRMTPALLSRQRAQLVDDAEKYEQSRYNQVFYPAYRSAIGNNAIVISGVLTRWAGELQVLSEPVEYRLSYVWYNGMPMLDAINVQSKQGQGNVK